MSSRCLTYYSYRGMSEVLERIDHVGGNDVLSYYLPV